jgi:tRNA(fMet)-specific endonuclease VapC
LRYLIDTGLLLRHLRGHNPSIQLLRGLSKDNRLCISAITRLEVQAGAHVSERYATQKLLSRFLNFDVTRSVADKAGELIYQRKQVNKPILVPDAVIAATATLNHLTLVTLNLQDFENISGLSLHPLSS